VKKYEIMREEMQEFMECWRFECRKYPAGYVPATKLLNTGFMLFELAKGGYIECNGVGYRPIGGA